MARTYSNLEIVVTGGSAGGLEALMQMVNHVPPHFPAAILVVLHTRGLARDGLAGVISGASPLEAVFPDDGETIRPGVIYVAPPDHHMLVEPVRIRLAHGPPES